jgi:hypothetical protein
MMCIMSTAVKEDLKSKRSKDLGKMTTRMADHFFLLSIRADLSRKSVYATVNSSIYEDITSP